MKGGVEDVLFAWQLIVRTGRYLFVLTLPLVCWMAAQECLAQALLAWAVQHGTALLTTPTTGARTRENLDISPISGDTLYEIDCI
jgi:diketogulonate reductase-like aldo/keto reductase